MHPLDAQFPASGCSTGSIRWRGWGGRNDYATTIIGPSGSVDLEDVRIVVLLQRGDLAVLEVSNRAPRRIGIGFLIGHDLAEHDAPPRRTFPLAVRRCD